MNRPIVWYNFCMWVWVCVDVCVGGVCIRMCGCGCVGVWVRGCMWACVHTCMCVWVLIITAVSPALVFTIILFQMKIEMHRTGKPQHVCLSLCFSFTMQIPFNIQSTSFSYLCCGRLLNENSVLGNSVWTLLNT